MKKELKEKAITYANTTEFPNALYFSTTCPDLRYRNYKYFFKYCNTNKVAYCFKTQRELYSFLESKGY